MKQAPFSFQKTAKMDLKAYPLEQTKNGAGKYNNARSSNDHSCNAMTGADRYLSPKDAKRPFP